MIKDSADLFAAEGEDAKDILDGLKAEAQDALDLALSEAPQGAKRERYRYVTERIFPLLLRLDDEGERSAALDDVAGRLGLRKTDLRKAFGHMEEQFRQGQDGSERDQAEENLLTPEPGTERYERAMELLRCPDILEKAAQDMERLGHVGEHTAKKLLLVCVVSARAGVPIQPSIHAESSSGKNYLADTVLLFLPPEMVIKRSAISAKALYRTGEVLKGKVLYLQEHKGSEDADFTFRAIQSDGKLIYEATEQGPDGSFRTVVHEKEGPLIILQTTTEFRLFDENDNRVFAIYLDESPEQTERIVNRALSTAATGSIPEEEREAILEVWHDAIRLLEAAEVIVPFAERIEAPARPVRMRRDINRLLDAIRVVAWLRQHARERDGLGRILATEEDYRIALALVSDSLQRAWKSLTPAEEVVLTAVKSLAEAQRRNGFIRNDLPIGDSNARRVQGALKALTESGYLECDRRRGPGGYRYTVSRDPNSKGLGISLRAPDDGGEDDSNDGSEDPDADAEEDPAQGHDTDEEEGEEDVLRAIARTGDRAIVGPLSPGEGAIARSREGDAGEHFEDDEPDDEEVDYVKELTGLGWYRAQTAFTARKTFPRITPAARTPWPARCATRSVSTRPLTG